MLSDRQGLISGGASFYAIVGDPIHLAKTPEIFNRRFLSKGIDAVFLPFHVGHEGLEGLFDFFRYSDNFKGMVVTMPYKSAVVRYIDRLTETAAVLQSVNVVCKEKKQLVGSMIDGQGMLRAIKRKNSHLFNPLSDIKIGMLGSGNAASAIAQALFENGAKNLLVFGDESNAEEAKSMLQRIKPSLRNQHVSVYAPQPCDLLINATPLGMSDSDALPFAPNLIAKAQLIADVVTSPTAPLIHQAQSMGIDTVDGFEMAQSQSGLIADLFSLPKLFD